MSKFSSESFKHNGSDYIKVSTIGFAYTEKVDGADISYDTIYLKSPTLLEKEDLEKIATTVEKLFNYYNDKITLNSARLVRELSPNQTVTEILRQLDSDKEQESLDEETLNSDKTVRKIILDLFFNTREHEFYLPFISNQLDPFFSNRIYLMRDNDLVLTNNLTKKIYTDYKARYYTFIEELFIEYFSFFLDFLPSRTLIGILK